MSNDLATLLREAREKVGLTQAEAASRFSVSVQAIANWESGGTPEPGRAHIISSVYNLRYDALSSMIMKNRSENYKKRSENYRRRQREQEEKAKIAENIITNANIDKEASTDPFASQIYMPLDIRVLGVSMGGSNYDFQFNGETVDYVRKPAGIANAKRAYAVYIVGESMYPAHREGDLVYVNPDRPPAIGDDVVIELHSLDGTSENGPAYIKRLKRRAGNKIVVEQFNPPKDIEFDREDIKNFHRVVPWNELLGV